MTIANNNRASRVVVIARLAVTLLLLGTNSALADQPSKSGFRQLSPEDRNKWLESLNGVLDGSRRAPAEQRTDSFLSAGLSTGAWQHAFDGLKWRVDEDGFVALDDGRRPIGLRIFARSCMARYGDSFRHWASVYGNGLKIAHLVATAVTESGCSELAGLGSVDGLSTGLMQVTGSSCRALVRSQGRPDLTERQCLDRMAQDPDFSISLGAAYITRPDQLAKTNLEPPKVAAAYNAGGVYFDPANPWHMRCTGNHIDRFVSTYNAYVAWYRDESSTRDKRAAAPKPLRLTRGGSLPPAVPSLESLQRYSAKDGDTVFVGDLEKKDGDFYVYADGKWWASTEDSSH